MLHGAGNVKGEGPDLIAVLRPAELGPRVDAVYAAGVRAEDLRARAEERWAHAA